jgi:hypothetical protein
MHRVNLLEDISQKQVAISAELADLVYKEDKIKSPEVSQRLASMGLRLVCTSIDYFRSIGAELQQTVPEQLRRIGGLDLSKLSSLNYQEEKAAQLCKVGSALLPDIERASSHGHFGVLVNEIGTNQFYLANIGTQPSKEIFKINAVSFFVILLNRYNFLTIKSLGAS